MDRDPWTGLVPLQVARANLRPFAPGERQPASWAESLHLVVAIAGGGLVTVRDREHRIAAGEALAVPWGEPAAFHADTRQGLDLASLHLVPWPGEGPPPEPREEWAAARTMPRRPSGAFPPLPAGAIRPLSQPHAADLALAAVATWNDRAHAPGWRAYRLRALAACLVAAFDPGLAQATRVDGLLRLMQNSLGKAFPRADMCRIAGLGSTALGRAVRAATGLSPSAYLISLRLDEARRLATATSLPILDIATMTGFRDRTHFARLFRRRFGASPRQIRQGG